MTKQKVSKKHHYLPRHYLKGFTDEAGAFFVYDKKTTKIFQTNPDAAFFENDLNTVEFPTREKSDFLEGLYTQMENQSWESLDIIRGSSQRTTIEISTKANLLVFLLFLHWRLPNNLSVAEELSQRFFGRDDAFDFFTLNRADGKTASREVIDEILSSSAFKKSARLILPFAPFFKSENWYADLVQWHFLCAGDDNNWFIVGDNPIITTGENDRDPVACLKRFVFPVSGRILLLGGQRPSGLELPPDFIIQHNTAIVERAERFVASSNRALLEATLKFHQLHVEYDKTGNIVEDLFAPLKVQTD